MGSDAAESDKFFASASLLALWPGIATVLSVTGFYRSARRRPSRRRAAAGAHLTVVFGSRGNRDVRAVNGISLDVAAGSTVGIVGESGSGRSGPLLAALGLLFMRGVTVSGNVEFHGQDMLDMSQAELRSVLGREFAMIFQDYCVRPTRS